MVSDADLPEILRPLTDVLPLNQAMDRLRPQACASDEAMAVGEHLSLEVGATSPLAALIWLYLDDLDRSHEISQGLPSIEGSYLHGMMHRREGDFSNANYWFRRSGSLPIRLGLDPIALTDEVARLSNHENPDRLVDAQRREWVALVEHCARQSA